MTTYRVSALAYGLARMWRAWTVIVPVIVVNAVLQALLVWPTIDVASWWQVWGLGLLSYVVFLAFYGLLLSAALQVADGRVGWGAAVGRLRAHLGAFLMWSVILTLATAVGLLLYVVPGLVVLVLTRYVLFAALDGHRNPIAVNFHAMGERFWRWLVTVLITGAILGLGTFLAGFWNFFLRDPVGPLVVWLIGGFLFAWFTTAFALIYRSTSVARG
jgi:hypothetical protein